jgi:MFS family permease
METPKTGPAVAPAGRPPVSPAIPGALFALATLFSMNLLNYVDRYVFFAVGAHIQKDLGISDTWFGPLSVSFMIVYTLVSPVVGWLGDRYNRRRLLAFGVGLWSLATVGTAFSQGFADMFVWRALLGVGEASYGVIAPALLADLFSTRTRGRVMGVYYLALPLGGALGYGIGGWVGGSAWGAAIAGELLGQRQAWRATFLVVGLPGLVAALAGLALRDPGRGASEAMAPIGDGAPSTGASRPRTADYLALFRNRTFLLNTAGMAAVTFATGAYAAWGSTFYQRVRGLTSQQAGAWLGGLTAAAGLIGIATGTWLADRLLRSTRRAYLLLATVAVLLAIPFGLAGLLDPEWRSSLALMFAAMILMAMVLGPCNTVTANVVPAGQRATGYAVSIFLIHLFGDISSPVLIGALSDFFGRPSVADSPIGRTLAALGARPVPSPTGPTNLTVGMLSVVPVLALGGVLFLLGSRHLAADQDRARQQGGGTTDGVLLH